jgi:Arc/MetJ family transcription regulator
MGRTHIELDDQLVERAMELTGARTTSEVVEIALGQWVEEERLYPSIRDLRGELRWEGDIDAWRSGRTNDP